MKTQPRSPFTTRQERENNNLNRFTARQFFGDGWLFWVTLVVATAFIWWMGVGMGRALERCGSLWGCG